MAVTQRGLSTGSYDSGNEHESGTLSSRSSLSDKASLKDDYVSPLKFFKVPVVRQYFHKGLLWRASDQQEVANFELFTDLLYVGIIAINGDYASEDATGLSLLHFIITFTMSYKIWNEMTLIVGWFKTNDLAQRLSVLFMLSCLVGYTLNITSAFESTYSQLIGFYLTARLYTGLYMLYVAIMVPMVRPVMLISALIAVLGSAPWIASIYVSWPNQLAPIIIGLTLDLTSHTIYLAVIGFIKLFPPLRKWADHTFSFLPALNIEHKIERTNAFVSLVFGYSVVALLFQNRSHMGLNAFFGKAIMGLIQAFCFNWLYFDIDGANIFVHAIRRHKMSAFTWINAHLPFIMAFILAGGALAKLVVATDCGDTDVDALTETYAERSVSEVEVGIKWFYCGGLGTALASMGQSLHAYLQRVISFFLFFLFFFPLPSPLYFPLSFSFTFPPPPFFFFSLSSFYSFPTYLTTQNSPPPRSPHIPNAHPQITTHPPRLRQAIPAATAPGRRARHYAAAAGARAAQLAGPDWHDDGAGRGRAGGGTVVRQLLQSAAVGHESLLSVRRPVWAGAIDGYG